MNETAEALVQRLEVLAVENAILRSRLAQQEEQAKVLRGDEPDIEPEEPEDA